MNLQFLSFKSQIEIQAANHILSWKSRLKSQ